MFCCGDWCGPNKYTSPAYSNDQYSNRSGGVSGFPGNRSRYVPTGGNALAMPPQNSNAPIVPGIVSPAPSTTTVTPIPVPPSKVDSSPVSTEPVIPAVAIPENRQDEQASTPATPSATPTAPTAQITPSSSPPVVNSFNSTPLQSNIPNTNPNQKLLLVKNPGVPVGTNINVEVPGENRLINCTVPNEHEFYVAYEPQNSFQQQQQQPVQGFGGRFNNNFNNNQNRYNNNNNNFSNGYYNNNNGFRNNGGPNNQYNNGYNGDNSYNSNDFGNGRYNNNRYNNGYNNGYNNRANGYNNRNYGNNGGGGMGWVAPVVGGAALMGAAGYMIHEHNQHLNDNAYEENNGNDMNDYGGGGDDYDAGGADDYDDGGGDFGADY